MDMIITSIKIDRRVRDASKVMADEVGLTFAAYFEELLLTNIKTKKPDLFQELCEGRTVFKRKEKRTAIGMEIDRREKEKERENSGQKKLPSGMEDLGQVIIEDEGAF